MNNIGHVRERSQNIEISIQEACKRKPQIYLNTLHFNEESYPVDKCGDGKEHFVYAFSEKKIIVINGSELTTENIILKRYHHNIKPRALPSIMKGEIAAYKALVQNGIPVPLCYANPQNVVDPVNDKSGGFWLLQKMPTSVKPGVTDVKILAKAKKFFNLNANSIHNGNGEVINDLRPPNVMLDKSGKMHVVDFSPTLKETEMARYNLNQNLIQWAAGKQEIFDHLIEDFPEELKNAMNMKNPVEIDDDDSF